MSMCQFISDNYKKYKQILIKNRDNYQKININIKKIEELLKQKEILIENLKPQKEQIDKLTTVFSHLITPKFLVILRKLLRNIIFT